MDSCPRYISAEVAASSMFEWQDSLAPGHRRDPTGTLLLGDVPAESLAHTYGTPLVVIDIRMVESAISEFRRVCRPLSIGISYAAKAFLSPEFAVLLNELDIGLDVCSLGELQLAERAGYQRARMTMHGVGKTDGEIRAAVKGRVGRIVVDGLPELERLADLAKGSQPIRTILRVNTGIEVHTHRHVRTAGAASKFGFVREEESNAADIFLREPALEFEGLHAHAGSQITSAETIVKNVSELIGVAERFDIYGLRSHVLVAGGGFGVQYDPDRSQDALDISATVSACHDVVRRRMSDLPVLEFEPGRSIIAHAGTTLYEALSVKRRGTGNILVVDGGMADNPRPAMYGAYHHVTPVAARNEPTVVTSVFGRACEDDLIARAMLPANIERGDLIAVCTTGAYTYSMASNYNGFSKPAVVAVRDGAHEVWIQRG